MPNRMTPASAVRKNPAIYSWLLNTYYRTTGFKPTPEELQLSEFCLEYLRSHGWSHTAMEDVEAAFERYNVLKASLDPQAAQEALAAMRERAQFRQSPAQSSAKQSS
ncbi:MAG TPA: hypothetical protein VEJ63_10970 [Planctomycetota bacterium]|nr:hypothetical protein [Planctomycetota bacterium]